MIQFTKDFSKIDFNKSVAKDYLSLCFFFLIVNIKRDVDN